LLAFAGVLVAVILRAITLFIERHTPLNGMFAYAATLFLIGGGIAGIGFLLVPRIESQVSQLMHTLPDSIQRLEGLLNRSEAGHALVVRGHEAVQHTRIGSHLPQIASAITDGVTDLIIIVVIGFFGALNPRWYEEGLLVLIPEARRERWRSLAGDLQHQLKWWVLGQLLPMIVLGLVSGLGLWILHVQLAWTLGLITGIAIFLPYAGTVLSGIPAVLMGLERSPHTALWVLVLYTILHLLEGYLLTPLVQRKAVRLPPVLTILTQYFFWNVAGILGLAVAAPMASAGIVLVKELYLHVPPEKEVVPEERIDRKSA
ncbi:MAG TPA: AI-2E family transporter, partial [Candidatus Angelobacter sp.]|nr:AI-2E family transporter [Candidatus Angelobacter sp.]